MESGCHSSHSWKSNEWKGNAWLLSPATVNRRFCRMHKAILHGGCSAVSHGRFAYLQSNPNTNDEPSAF
ncbi:hypothetical protein TNCV_4264081 [Trichonephila clavipes]|nr:hypothetical protein TNCV_4264081 [Trichonephila clavipes]